MSDEQKRYDYEGEHAVVQWDGRLCIHVGECGRAEGELFVTGRQPWCQPDMTDEANVAEVVARCPTGALTLKKKDGTVVGEAAPSENRCVVANHGPFYFEGELKIAGAADDMPSVSRRAALCRCGHSKNKPFCDNAHEEAGFQDRGAIGQRGDALEATGGELSVTTAPNGPLLVKGNLALVAASGRVAWTGTRAALCRCGHSKNKPFCDGAHKAAGFVAD